MKNIFTGLATLLGLLLLMNCSTKNTHAENIHREWMLVEFQDFTKEVMVKNKAKLDLSRQQEPGKFSANMGCNNMFGSVVFNLNGSAKFSEVGSTMMYCKDAMELESAFGKALPKMNRYKVEGHYLTLSDPAGNKMKFVAADWD